MNSIKDDYNISRMESNRRSICFASSVNMLFATDGTVKACCHNHENSLGRYPEKSISEIWNSAEAIAFRREMEDFRFLSGCRDCAADFNSGNFSQMPARHFDSLPRHPQYPTMMEFLLSNICNLECVMCSGELSSSIRSNRDKLPPIKSPYDRELIKQLEEFLPHLIETRFSGAGEAFSIAIYYELWDMLIRLNPKCLIVVQTNGTILNAKVKDYLERGNFQIGVSLDSLQKETYESIRLNASFDRVMDNITYFAEYSRQRNKAFTISTCVMRNNWKELPDFIQFCNRIGAGAALHKVWSPLEYALYNLSASELEEIHATLHTHIPSSNNDLEKRNREHYHYFLSVIKRWVLDAEKRERTSENLGNFTNAELLERVKRSLENYILEQNMLEDDRLQLITQCKQKVDAVMFLWKDEERKRNILLKLCSIPVSEMLPALKSQPVEKLFEMSSVN